MKAVKKRVSAKKQTGRPRLPIDPEQVEQLAAIDCSYAEMAAVLGCDQSTLTRRFAQAIEKGRATGKSSLKRQQFKLAMDGNATMLIWLGKIRLGQKETTVQEHIGKDGAPIAHEISVRFVSPTRADSTGPNTRRLNP